MSNPGTVTRAVNALAAGQAPTTSEPHVERIYNELKSLAASRLRRDPGAPLQPTELVHEAVLKLFREGQKPWESRAHFFGSAARAMQQLLVDESRRRPLHPEPLGDRAGMVPGALRARDPVALTRAIDELHAHDARLAEIVRLRMFAGLSAQQTAELLDISPRTLSRHWSFACAWLVRHLSDAEPGT